MFLVLYSVEFKRPSSPKVVELCFLTIIPFGSNVKFDFGVNIGCIKIGGIRTIWTEKIPPNKLLKYTRSYCSHTTF